MKHSLPHPRLLGLPLKVFALQLLLAGLLAGMATAHPVMAQLQLDQKVTFHARAQTIEAALNQLEKQLNVRFVYSPELIGSGRQVTIDVVKEPLAQVLNQLLTPVRTQYEVQGNRIILRLLEPAGQPGATVPVSGRVTQANGEGLPGVTVLVKGTTTGTQTNASGAFTLDVPEGSTLVFSNVGYARREVAITGATKELAVTLQEDAQALNEVVVVGYGTQKREQVTSAIASVKAEDFVKGSVGDAGQLIRGKVPGLAVNTSSGDPTAVSQINIRGLNTINSGTGPLVLIDGVPGSLNTVAPEDIESVDVLKDGSAAAIYGTRGNNGVILITTRKVKGDTPTTVEIDSYVTTQSITKRLNFMNAEQYRSLAIGHSGAVDYGHDTNWLDQVLRTPFSQVYNVSLRGGTRTTQYIANVNYRSLQGIFLRSDNQVLYPRFEVIHSMFDGKVKLDANVLGSQQTYFAGSDGNSFNAGVYRNALNYNPTDQPKDSTGRWTEHIDRTDYANPVALLRETTGKNQSTNLRGYGTVSYSPIDNLEIKLLGSRDITNSSRGYYETRKHYSTIHDGRNGYASRGTTRLQEDLMELTGQYNKSLGNHNLSGLAGYGWREYTLEDYYMQNYDFPTDDYTYNNIGAGLALSRGQARESSYQSQNKLVSYFFRFNYSYQDKYLLSASIRREGSSKFGVNNKWGNFPAISAGWNIAKEAFMSSASLVSTLKVRGGFGVTGTEPGSPYQSLNRLGFGNNTYYNGQWIQAVAPVNNANPNLKWETKQETNLGLDFGFLKNRLTGSVDVYRRRTKDLLVDYPVPTPPYLFGTLLANAAVMENKGIEVQLNATPVQLTDFQWNTTLNFSANKNQIVSLSDENFSIASGYFDRGDTGEPIQQPISRVQIGQPIGNFFGYKTVDIDKDGHWIIEGKEGTPKPIADQQNDDKQILGNGLPKRYLAWNNALVYKKFDLNVTMRGAFGFQILNTPRMYYEAPVMLNRGNVLATTFDNVYGKRPLADDQSLQYVSYYVENGNYWKIDNVTLGYNLSLNSKYVKRIRIYASANNLKTFTSYTGIDPEVSTSYNGDFLVPGVDSRNRYPLTRTYTLGAFATF